MRTMTLFLPLLVGLSISQSSQAATANTPHSCIAGQPGYNESPNCPNKVCENLGTTRLADNETDIIACLKTSEAGQGLKWKAMTDAGSDGLGYDQTWVNVTTNRQVGQNYNNNTGKPIFVSININSPTYESAALSVNGMKVGVGGITGTPNSSHVFGTFQLSAVVPNGSNYALSYTRHGGGEPVTTIWRWLEFRSP